MLNISSFFSSISSLWSELFEDKDILKSIYTILASKISDSYSKIMSLPANLRLLETSDTEIKTISPLYIDTSTRAYFDISESISITVYGITSYLSTSVKSSQRLYTSSDLSLDSYFENGFDYTLYRGDSSFINDLKSNTSRNRYFSRYSTYIVFFDDDPLRLLEAGSQQEAPLSYYLVGTVTVDSSTSEVLQTTKVVQLEVSGIVSTIKLPGCENLEGNIWRIQLPDEEYIPDSDIESVFIVSETGARLKVKFSSKVIYNPQVISLYAPRLSVISNALADRFIHILSPEIDLPTDYVLDNSESLKYKLIAVQRAKLLEASPKTIENVISTFCDLPLLLQSTAIDRVNFIDNLRFKVSIGTRRFSILPRFPFNPVFIESLTSLPVSDGTVTRSNCKKLHINFTTASLLSTSLGYPLPAAYAQSITVRDINSTFQCRLILVTSEFIAVDLFTGTIPASGPLICKVEIDSYTTELVEVTGFSSFSSQELAADPFTTLQHAARVYDISFGTDWWKNIDSFVPEKLWNNGNRRNNVQTGKWPAIVGHIKEHRIGDYGIIISDEFYNSTAWNLFRDIFVRNTCFIVTSPLLNRASVDAALFSRKLISLGTATIVDSSLGLVEVVQPVSENLELLLFQPVGKDELNNAITLFSDQGIGNANVLVYGKFELPLSYITTPYNLIIGSYIIQSSNVENLDYKNGLVVFTIDHNQWFLSSNTLPTTATIQLESGETLPTITNLEIYNIVGSPSLTNVVGCELPQTPYEASGNSLPILVTDHLDIEEV